MKNIKEVQIDNEIVYLKKGFLGWHIVYPYKINNKINWKNLISGGNWWNLLIIGFIILIILGCIYEYSNAIKVANECMSKLEIFKIKI